MEIRDIALGVYFLVVIALLFIFFQFYLLEVLRKKKEVAGHSKEAVESQKESIEPSPPRIGDGMTFYIHPSPGGVYTVQRAGRTSRQLMDSVEDREGHEISRISQKDKEKSYQGYTQ